MQKDSLITSMKSQVVDELWHSHILHTRDYANFCDKAFSHMLHHLPYFEEEGEKLLTYDANFDDQSIQVHELRKSKPYQGNIWDNKNTPLISVIDSYLGYDNQSLCGSDPDDDKKPSCGSGCGSNCGSSCGGGCGGG